jgi:hypothetical protein
MATNTHSSQQGEMGHQDEGGVSRRAQMHGGGDRCGGLIPEDSSVTTLIQCSMHALLGISCLNHHV